MTITASDSDKPEQSCPIAGNSRERGLTGLGGAVKGDAGTRARHGPDGVALLHGGEGLEGILDHAGRQLHGHASGPVPTAQQSCSLPIQHKYCTQRGNKLVVSCHEKQEVVSARRARERCGVDAAPPPPHPTHHHHHHGCTSKPAPHQTAQSVRYMIQSTECMLKLHDTKHCSKLRPDTTSRTRSRAALAGSPGRDSHLQFLMVTPFSPPLRKPTQGKLKQHTQTTA